MTVTNRPVRVDTNGGEYPADLYRFDTVAETVPGLDRVGEAEVRRYRDEGYLAVAPALTEGQVGEAIEGLRALLLDPRGADVEFEAWAADRLDELDGEERFDAVRKFMWFVDADERLRRISRDERLLAVVRQLAGSDDVVMMQDMALLKPPGGGREKPWHQDNAFFNLDPETPTVGVWIALDPATAENGCMHVISGSHREGPAPHFKRRDWQLCDGDVQTSRDVVVPLPPGGALFFNGLIHHGTPANRTTLRRRAVQFHYVPRAAVRVTEDEHLAVFGSEGRGATC
jgi:phytanoyl-CoA hydroxylase